MKTKSLFIVIIGFIVLSLVGVSNGWQGRMTGMGDPYGLVEDESDFLIHPAEIANGKGINFYSNYRFNYRDVMDWNYSLDFFNAATGAFMGQYSFKGSGDEREHEALLGAALPLGPGRMGFFFEYAGRRNDYDGNPIVQLTPYGRYSMDSDLDAFALRLLYGLPMGGFKLGGEIQLAYRHEKNETNFWYGPGPAFFENLPIGGISEGNVYNLFPFMRPYDSKYWEAIFKGSLKGAIGPIKVSFTLHGGFIFSGDNNLMFTQASPTNVSGVNLDGNVEGWNIGGDLWMRYPLEKGLSLPFLLKVDYQKKTRDGDGPGAGSSIGSSFDYKNRERNFQLEVGGGVDKELVKGTRIAGGIYYGFLQNQNDFLFTDLSKGTLTIYNHTKYPDQTEHRVILRLAGEKEISPMVSLRMGLNFFYGWVKEDFNAYFDDTIPSGFQNQSIDGSHWGIGASLGGTVKFQQFSFEPFLCGGYQKWDLDGTGFASGTPGYFLNMDKLRKEWLVGGGLSIKF